MARVRGGPGAGAINPQADLPDKSFTFFLNYSRNKMFFFFLIFRRFPMILPDEKKLKNTKKHVLKHKKKTNAFKIFHKLNLYCNSDWTINIGRGR